MLFKMEAKALCKGRSQHFFVRVYARAMSLSREAGTALMEGNLFAEVVVEFVI